ncbi:unnamed protein product [Lasius platythorax]|uniref:Uncharacterized protein n=1 Tax=Lasius platythorax TaxID=488582 RepID=A0AAV2N8H1_9HYME
MQILSSAAVPFPANIDIVPITHPPRNFVSTSWSPVTAHVVTTTIPRRENLRALTKAASRTYLAFSTYIESWACRMLRRPPRIKQIKTSGARGA